MVSTRSQTQPSSTMPKTKHTADQLLSLYQQDRLVIHTMPPPLIDKRPDHMRDDHSMMCGSILFHKGLLHKPSGKPVPNAVARFGDDSKSTVFATLHDLERIFDHHEQLERQKAHDKGATGGEQQQEEWAGKDGGGGDAEGRGGTAFVYFTNSDISDIAKRAGGDHPRNYLEATWGITGPVHCQRPRGFDFRNFCSTIKHKEDENMEKIGGAEWNEIRAVLNWDNMVGLVYIHDPEQDPQDHLEMAARLRNNFNNEHVMLVFKVKEPGGCSGDLVTTDDGKGGERLVTMEEYLRGLDITAESPLGTADA